MEKFSPSDNINHNSTLTEQGGGLSLTKRKVIGTAFHRMKPPFRRYRLQSLPKTDLFEPTFKSTYTPQIVKPYSKIEELSKRIKLSSRKAFLNHRRLLMNPFKKIILESFDQKVIPSKPHPELVDQMNNQILNFFANQLSDRTTHIDLSDTTIHDRQYTHKERINYRNKMGYNK